MDTCLLHDVFKKDDMNIYDLSGNMAVNYRNALWDRFLFFDKERPPAKIEDNFYKSKRGSKFPKSTHTRSSQMDRNSQC